MGSMTHHIEKGVSLALKRNVEVVHARRPAKGANVQLHPSVSLRNETIELLLDILHDTLRLQPS